MEEGYDELYQKSNAAYHDEKPLTAGFTQRMHYKFQYLVRVVSICFPSSLVTTLQYLPPPQTHQLRVNWSQLTTIRVTAGALQI